MVHPSRKWLHCLALYALSVGRFALSSLDPEVPAIKNSVKMLQSVVQPESSESSQAKINTPIRYYTIDDQLLRLPPEARRDKIKLLAKEIERLKVRIKSLDTQSKPEFLIIQSQLEELYQALKPSILERVRRLSGLGPSMSSLEFIVNPGSTEEEIAAQVLNGDHLPTLTTGIQNEGNREPALQVNLTPNQGSESVSSSPQPATTEILPTKNLLAARVQGGRSKSRFIIPKRPRKIQIRRLSPYIQLRNSKARGRQAKTVETLSDEGDGQIYTEFELYGDVLHVVKEHLYAKEMKTWRDLEEVLIGFQTSNHLIESDTKFLLGFLKTFYTFGNLIHDYQLMPSSFIKNIEIFQPNNIFRMLEYYINLLFSKWNGKFFDIPGSLTPQLEFLTNGVAVKHFHRPIKELSKQHQIHVVYLVLRTIMRHAPWGDPTSSPSFLNICEEFNQNHFLDKLNGLSSALIQKKPGIDALTEPENRRVVRMIELTINHFQNPSNSRSVGKTERIEFLLVYYILDFLDRYYQPIIKTIMQERGSKTSQLFQKQIKFMRSYLNYFRYSLEFYWYFMYRGRDVDFRQLAKDAVDEDPLFDRWIIIVTHLKIRQDGLERGVIKTIPRFNLWMGQVCWKCNHPFRGCPETCHRFLEPEELGDDRYLEQIKDKL
ncbi:hypothetical protein PSTG_15494 [Puccinia striiformis f. sp. tritici PST-78]|uniref:Uncharacterized protein n=1 Tax=Puccinia striiformis f. sp. tritici PST-78 TaxID=1165861 RepID=A0A0L0UVM5_9BASI|nr:hypothetical protein PSTG_15494 [Puccinia striiformis f. sp. tritici PST-78]